MRVAIVDYGSGNLRSAAKAFERAARERDIVAEIRVTSDVKELREASRIVLPGVGAFSDCCAGLKRRPGLWEALVEEVKERGKSFLGICVGMQLMAERGLEFGVTPGFGWIKGEVRRIEPADQTLKIPHMGWNSIELRKPHAVLNGLRYDESGSHAYFVHSFALHAAQQSDLLAVTDYGGPITAAVARDNMVGVQFHPEKSQVLGLNLIGNFLEWQP
jgi:glutamine amidotransferase